MNEDSSSNGSGNKTWIEKLGRALGADPRNREDLLEVLREVTRRGVIETDTLTMIEGALSVDQLQVRDVMVPRSHMVVVPRDASVEQVLDIVLESGHSRFPVVGDDKDEIIGILLAKDLLQLFGRNGKTRLDELMRTPVIIPESKRLNVLLQEFRVSRNHIAIVVDEYGGVSGLATIEDVLEEIVGDIDDEHDAEGDEAIQQREDGSYRVQALLGIDDFNKAFGSRFQDDEYDTIGGLVVSEFGRLPEQGEFVIIGSWRFVVAAADERRLLALDVSLAE